MRMLGQYDITKPARILLCRINGEIILLGFLE